MPPCIDTHECLQRVSFYFSLVAVATVVAVVLQCQFHETGWEGTR